MNNQTSSSNKKGPTSIIIIAACLLGVAFGIFGLNYWHASRCSNSKPPEEIEKFVEAINRRLLMAESQVVPVNVLLNISIFSLV